MLSRVADSIYWMSRYIERAENTARFIDVNLNLSLDLPMGTGEQWQPLVDASGDREQFSRRFGLPTRENVIAFLSFDQENPNSILSCVRAARENARSVRDSISGELWEQINKFYLMVVAAGRDGRANYTPHDFYADVKQASHLIMGQTDLTMSHGEAWHFARLGRLIERADKTTRILDVKYFILLPAVDYVGTPFDELQWSAVLRSASALEMYRKRHGRIMPDRVVDFLVLDREFPRAVHYCLIKADESLHAITGSPAGRFTNTAEQRLGQLRSEFSYMDVASIVAEGLHEFLDNLQLRLNQIGDNIFQTFFALRPLSGSGLPISA